MIARLAVVEGGYLPTFPDPINYSRIGPRRFASFAPCPKKEEQEGPRVTFERPLPANMMAIDGTWRRSCAVKDISESSATLKVEASVEGLALTEFFLLLSSIGLAYRRCQLVRVNGAELEVGFLRPKKPKKRA